MQVRSATRRRAHCCRRRPLSHFQAIQKGSVQRRLEQASHKLPCHCHWPSSPFSQLPLHILHFPPISRTPRRFPGPPRPLIRPSHCSPQDWDGVAATAPPHAPPIPPMLSSILLPPFPSMATARKPTQAQQRGREGGREGDIPKHTSGVPAGVGARRLARGRFDVLAGFV